MAAVAEVLEAPFAGSVGRFEGLVSYLQAEEAMRMRHSDLEREIFERGRELLRQLLQDHLNLRGPGQARGPVRDADGSARTRKRMQERDLETVLGVVQVERVGYGAKGEESVHPLDAELNLPEQRYSHELERRVAEEAARGSFEEAAEAVKKQTGQELPKRQAEEIARRAAQDFDAFYAQRQGQAMAAESSQLLVITTDAKGVVVRREDLREQTRKAAKQRAHKLSKRLSKGEKRNAKRMAQVASVYTVAPVMRTAEDVVRGLTGVGPVPEPERAKPPRARPEHKRVWASVEKSPEEVIEQAFEEGRHRDPGSEKKWVALVDGNETQFRILHEVSTRLGIALTIVLDIVHVAQYLWAAGLAFFVEGSRERELWVAEQLAEILRGRVSVVVGAMRRRATRRGLTAKQREPVEKCATYLLGHAQYMRYHEYLAGGFPVATGVIEGACRYLVKDRMEITGARWSLTGAEAVLRLRALRASGDFDEYWRFHEDQEYTRNHVARYADGKVPVVDTTVPTPKGRQIHRRHHLRVVK